MMNFYLNNFKKDKETKEREEMLKLVALAYKQWKERESLFQDVIDPDLIDYAIYQMEASRLKYIYLLKKFREEEVKKDIREDNLEDPSLNHG